MVEKSDKALARTEKIAALIKGVAKRVLILVSHVDPDSLGSAKQMSSIVEFLGKSADIYYGGQPGHPQNQMIMGLFELNRTFKPVVQLTEQKRSEYDLVILLDSPTLDDDRFGIKMGGLKAGIIIDHHEPPKDPPLEGEASCYWQESCGACCTLVAKLLFELGVSLKDVDDAASLGLIGILADTSSLTSSHTTKLDYRMVGALGQHVDQQSINEVFFSTLDKKFLSLLHTACDEANCTVSASTFIVCLNEIAPEMEDYMPRIADMFIKLRGIHTVYVWAIVKDPDGKTRFTMKVRNSDRELAPRLDQRLKGLFGDNYGGAKDGASGAVSKDLGFHGRTKERDALIQIYKVPLNEELLR